MMRVALDSNILVYLARFAKVPGDDAKIDRIATLMGDLSGVATVMAPVQALGECFYVLRRAGRAAEAVRDVLADFAESFAAPASEKGTALAAADLVVDHKLQFWDAMILAAAADAGCALLLSEDMQHGFMTRGVTVVNPFAEPMHERLARVLEG